MDDISIDRLILEIPGLTAEQGKELARHIGAALAASTAGPGEFQTLSVTLDAGEVDGKHAGVTSPERLATAIVAALLRQTG